MTSQKKINANRANASASTGPKTKQGRARSARNALRHGLSLPLDADPDLTKEAEALAHGIAGPSANAETLQHARRIAEAQIDLQRMRSARHQLLSRALNDPRVTRKLAAEAQACPPSSEARRAGRHTGSHGGPTSLEGAGTEQVRDDPVGLHKAVNGDRTV